MIKLLSRSVIALTLILGFAPAVKPISVSEADSLYAQATTTDEEKLETANRLFNEGLALFEQGTKESLLQALEKLQQALPLYQAANKLLEEATTLLFVGSFYSSLGKKETAIDYYKQALPIFQKLKNRNGESTTLNNLGLAYNSLGEKQKALDYYHQALLLSQLIDDLDGEATTLNNLGRVYDSLGEKQKALNYLKQALPKFQVIRNQRGEAITLNNLGLVYDSLGEKQKALDYYNQALPIRRKVGDHAGEATTLNNLSYVYDSLGEKQKALDYLEQVLSIVRAIDDIEREANALNNIGSIYYSLENQQKALDYLNQALAIVKVIGVPIGEATTLNNLGLVYNSSGEKQKALNYYNQSLAINRDIRNRDGEASNLNNIGNVYNSSEEKKKALNYYKQSLQILREIGKRTNEAITIRNIALIHYDDKNYNTALQTIDKAIDIVEKIRSKIIDSDFKASFFSTVEDYYKLKTAILMQLHQQNPNQGYDVLAFETSEQGKARSLLELLEEANIDIRQGVNPELVTEEKRLQYKLDAVEKRRISLCSKDCSDEKQLNKLETERSELLEQYQQIQTQIRSNSPEYAELTQPEPIKLQKLQKLLDEDTVLWQYSLWRDKSYVWVISKDSCSTHELASREEIETLAREYSEPFLEDDKEKKAAFLSTEGLKKLTSTGTKLSQLILPPSAEATQKPRVVIVSDGALQYIPFASLPTEDNNLLSNNHQIINLPSSSVLESLRTNQQDRKPPAKQIAILADPVFGGSDDIRLPQKQQPGTEDLKYDLLRSAISSSDLKLSRLDDTRTEANNILALVPQSQQIAVFDWDANLEFATNPELSNYKIVHFATHGILNSERPELSGIVLSLFDEQGNPQNGFLRLHEVFNLNLPADLVVLSACETGLGKEIRGEGLVGLTRGFMYAGATRVLVSLWKVDDAATAEFMSKFYGFMLQDKLSPASALNATQKYMQNHDEWSHPFYWAAFTLQGDWVNK